MSPAVFPRLNRPAARVDRRGSQQARLASVAAFSAAAFCALLISCGSKTGTSSVLPAQGTNAPTSAPAINPELAKLVGKWERPDGGYVLEIKSVEPGGRIDAAYFNPEPIKVSRAAALRDGGATKVFVELSDVNYPGCTYSLTYDSQNEQLFGQYYQAAMQQTFDVVFARMK